MTAIDVPFAPSTAKPGSVAKNKWSWPHYLSVAAIPILFFNIWTVVSWLADGPHQITQYRDVGSMSWWATKFLEAVVIIGSILVIRYLIGDCRQQRRFLTFNVMFCMAGFTMFWLDQQPAMIAPTWLPSSNFVNLNSTCGHTPWIVVNPQCDKVVDPIMFDFFLETFCCLGIALLIGRYVSRLRERNPGISNLRVFAVIMLWGMFAEFLLEAVVAVPFHAWNYPPGPLSVPMGHGFSYPIVELFDVAAWFGLFAAVWIFRNDKGETVAERGLERHRPSVRKGLTLLSLYTLIQFISFAPGNGPLTVWALYEHHWPKLPTHIVNGFCDNLPGERTAYGPCPGSPGFRLPIRHSLSTQTP